MISGMVTQVPEDETFNISIPISCEVLSDILGTLINQDKHEEVIATSAYDLLGNIVNQTNDLQEDLVLPPAESFESYALKNNRDIEMNFKYFEDPSKYEVKGLNDIIDKIYEVKNNLDTNVEYFDNPPKYEEETINNITDEGLENLKIEEVLVSNDRY